MTSQHPRQTEEPVDLPEGAPALLAFETFELDRARFELRRDGERIHMEPQVFEVLTYLVANHDRLVTKQELLDHVWPESYITEAALNSRLMAARKAIGDSGRDQRLIKTVHGRGFRFVGAVRTVEANVPIPAPRSPAVMAVASAGVIGREPELERLAELVTNPACRLLTIAGPGGVGKTRLVVELARRQRLLGREIAYATLESAEDAGEVPWTIAAALGRNLQRDGSVDELVERLGDHEHVIILDNFEHLLPAGALIIAELLARSPALRVIVTSRAVLGLQEEWLFPLGGLGLESQDGARPGAVELFLARVARSNAMVAPGAEGEMLTICRLVDGMPLAIELAAGLSRYIPLAELAASIERDVSVLRTDLRDVPARHRSIPGLLEESVRQLNIHQIGALLACSIFEGDFSREAASVVADADLAMLGGLADLSLIQARGGRFAMHPLLRQFARTRLADAADRLRERHATFFVDFLAVRKDDLEGRRQLAAMEEIEPELANCLAAWRWAVSSSRFDLLDRAVAPLTQYCLFHSRFHDSNDATASALAALEGVENWNGLRLLLLVGRAWTCIRGGPHRDVPGLVRGAMALFNEDPAAKRPGLLSDPRALAAWMRTIRGDYPGAYRLAMELVEATEASGDLHNNSAALWMAAFSALRACEFEWVMDDPAEAYGWRGHCVELPGQFSMAQVLDLLDRAERALERTGDRWLRSYVEIELGLASEVSDPGSALAHFELACELRESFNDRDGLAAATVYLAGAALESGDPERAVELNELVAELLVDLGDAGQEVELSRQKGLTASYLGQRVEAFHLFEESVQGSLRLAFMNNTLGGLRGVSELIDRDDPALARSIATLLANHGGAFPFSRAKARAHLRVLPATDIIFDSTTPLEEVARITFKRAGDILDPGGSRLAMTWG